MQPLRALLFSSVLLFALGGTHAHGQWRPEPRPWENVVLHDTVEIRGKKPTKRELRKHRKRVKRYKKLVYDVRKVYPYALIIAELVRQTEAKMDQFESKRDKRRFVEALEEELFDRYEKDMRKLTLKQGKILIKLVYRETDNSAYRLIKEYRSGFKAVFWQMFARLLGADLKEEYDPRKYRAIEQIVRRIEYEQQQLRQKQTGKKPLSSGD